MKRCMVAVDVQSFYKPSQGVVHQINQLVAQLPTAATLFVHNEEVTPLKRMKKDVPSTDQCLVTTPNVYNKHGFTIPKAVIDWLHQQEATEVLITGGHTDANVLAAGFSIFDAGFTPLIVPMLCYGNDWYMHTVTTKIWEQHLGKVYESSHDLHFTS